LWLPGLSNGIFQCLILQIQYFQEASGSEIFGLVLSYEFGILPRFSNFDIFTSFSLPEYFLQRPF
jgi:hypothetical protein